MVFEFRNSHEHFLFSIVMQFYNQLICSLEVYRSLIELSGQFYLNLDSIYTNDLISTTMDLKNKNKCEVALALKSWSK